MKYKSLSKFKIGNKPCSKNKIISFFNKIMICTIILLLSLIVMKKSPKVKKFITEKVFNNNISFAYIKNLYSKYFGDVIPSDSKTVSVFDEKITYSKKEKYLDGAKLTVSKNYLVPIIETGIIVFIGNKEEYGNTIVIEQVDGNNIWYGNIKTDNVKLYDYVVKGNFLGETLDDKLYLVLEKEGEYLDIENILS